MFTKDQDLATLLQQGFLSTFDDILKYITLVACACFDVGLTFKL